MAFSDRAMEAISQNIQACVGCGCEVEYEYIEFLEVKPGKFTVCGYSCACGAIMKNGLFMGSSAMGRR